ncbi:YfjI family protein [Candidatus Magnetaquicoccus inordinatus]|uniref:YfjI family protein n=1 Tax=Candidatus Magnetaquicoccus inordinatus TaxID=2496818 RepID=UPI00102AD9AE|nr:YfjI family protein [Candidatus Magnetaquicoccus inordinatus]
MENPFAESLQMPVVDPWPDIQSVTSNDEPAPFPTEALPQSLLTAAAEIARFTKTDIASAATVCLSVAATAVGKKARIEERPGLYHYPALFFVVIAGSGERKSPVFKSATFPLEQWAESQAEQHAAMVAMVQAENAVADAQLASLKRQAGKELDPAKRAAIAKRIAEETAKRRQLPASPRLFASDVTEEALFRLQHARNGEYSVMTGEGRSTIDQICGRYASGGRTADSIYLAGVSGDTVTRDRIGSSSEGPENSVIVNPCLNVCIMIQPDKFSELLSHPSLKESGLVARILPVKPVSLVGQRFEEADEAGLDESATAGFYRTVTGFLNSKRPTDPATGRAVPHLARLGAVAKEARRQWHNTVEALMAPGRELEGCRDIASKAVTQCVKIALVLHLLEKPEQIHADHSELSLAMWRSAQLLAEHFLETAFRFRESATAKQSPEQRFAEWLQRTGKQTVTSRDVISSGPSPRPRSVDEVLPIFEELSNQGILRKHPSKNEWQVNPKLKSASCFSASVGC